MRLRTLVLMLEQVKTFRVTEGEMNSFCVCCCWVRLFMCGATCWKTPISRSALDKNPMPDTSSKETLWMKAQHQGALTPLCIVRKIPQVPHTARQVACHPVNNWRGERSSIPPTRWALLSCPNSAGTLWSGNDWRWEKGEAIVVLSRCKEAIGVSMGSKFRIWRP